VRTTSVSSPPAPDATSPSAGPASRPPAGSATSWHDGSSRAAEDGDLSGLEALLAHDAALTGDGGGKVPALARSLRGRTRVARTVIGYWGRVARVPGVSLRPVEVNGGPGALVVDPQQRLLAVVALEVAGGQVTSISAILNPDKLARLGPLADYRSLLRSTR
jgi:hypothetical protein